MTTGWIWIVYNDIKLLPTAYNSFIQSIEGQFGCIGIDVGSNDSSFEFLQPKMEVLSPRNPERLEILGYKPEDLVHLSKCLNMGIKVFQTRTTQFDNVGWAHVDVDYWNNGHGKGWAQYLENYLVQHPDVVKVTPESEPNPGVLGERPGNQCPWMISTKGILALQEKYGEVFPENYIYAHFEDYCLNARLLKLGYKVMIVGSPPINHEGAGSRKNSPNRTQWEMAYGYNSQLYFNEFGTHDPLV